MNNHLSSTNCYILANGHLYPPKLGLKSLGKVNLHGVGDQKGDLYKISLAIPNSKVFHGLYVYGLDMDDYEILIGIRRKRGMYPVLETENDQYPLRPVVHFISLFYQSKSFQSRPIRIPIRCRLSLDLRQIIRFNPCLCFVCNMFFIRFILLKFHPSKCSFLCVAHTLYRKYLRNSKKKH